LVRSSAWKPWRCVFALLGALGLLSLVGMAVGMVGKVRARAAREDASRSNRVMILRATGGSGGRLVNRSGCG
jgi:hypothetical protein